MLKITCAYGYLLRTVISVLLSLPILCAQSLQLHAQEEAGDEPSERNRTEVLFYMGVHSPPFGEVNDALAEMNDWHHNLEFSGTAGELKARSIWGFAANMKHPKARNWSLGIYFNRFSSSAPANYEYDDEGPSLDDPRYTLRINFNSKYSLKYEVTRIIFTLNRELGKIVILDSFSPYFGMGPAFTSLRASGDVSGSKSCTGGF